MLGSFKKNVKSLYCSAHPLRKIFRFFIMKTGVLNYKSRYFLGALERPHYAYCIYQAASLAKKLGLKRISVVEFGVAAGGGLLDLEYHAKEIERIFSIEIEVYGFDSAEGLPAPKDYRDLPYLWKEGFYGMDFKKLQKKLKKAKLVIGNVDHTKKDFFDRYHPAPIGAIMYDLDFYSSTQSVFDMLKYGDDKYLPRVFTYFDDINGTQIDEVLYSDYTGERLAIQEFNSENKFIKFDSAYNLITKEIIDPWNHQIRIIHFFQHKLYNDFIKRNTR